MTYQVIERCCGAIVRVHEGIEASSSLEAINRIEAMYKPVQTGMSNGGDTWKVYEWTGREFEARAFKMFMS